MLAFCLLVLASAANSAARGQLLDLSPPPPLPAPSELELVAKTRENLELEQERLRLARTVASQRQQPAIDAMLALRSLAGSSLLWAVERAGEAPQGWRELEDALRLVEGLPVLDAAIRGTLVAAPAAAGHGADDGLRRFSAAVGDDPALAMPGRCRDALSILLQALDQHALSEASWPRDDGRGVATAPPAPPPVSLLRERLAASPRAAEVQASMSALLDSADGSASAESLRRRLAADQLLELLDASRASGVLDRARRDAFDAHVAALAASLISTPPSSPPGAAPEGSPPSSLTLLSAREAAATARLLNRAEAVRGALGDASRTLSLLPPLLLRLDTQVAPDASPPPWRAKQAVESLLEELVASRTLESGPSSPALAAPRMALFVEIRKTEKSLVDSLGAVLEAPSLMTDPAIASLVRSHRLLAEDLRWLADIPAQARAVAAFDPSDSTALERALTQRFHDLATDLADHARRPDALQARAQLSRQIAAFSELPGERTEREAAMIALLGAERWSQTRQAIVDARRDWARSWATDEGGGPSARRLLSLLRTVRCAEAVALLSDTAQRDAVAGTLARWSGWSIPAEALEGAVEARTRLANDRSADGPQAERQLRQMEETTALARLALRLAPALAPALGTTSSPAAAVLAPLVSPPPLDAWGLEHLETLARIAVLARAWVAVRDDDATAAPLREALDREANTLLHEMGEWRGPIPTLRRVGVDFPPSDEHRESRSL